MPKKNKRRNNDQEVVMPEDFRISLDKIFKDFMNDITSYEYTFPSDLSNVQRKYIHEKSRVLGLKSKSYGKEPNRAIRISKKEKNSNTLTCQLTFSENAAIALNQFKQMMPNTNFLNVVSIKETNNTVFQPKFTYGYPVIAPQARENELTAFRKNLPIFNLKDDILNLMSLHQVLVVSAETGSGKTTQIPQYILEQSNIKSKPCRIICTQPRRLSTVAVAERVATERSEVLGYTVGYQIKLESKLGPNTSLIYCTNGVLLRTLMSVQEKFDTITHIIVDEIHERDKYTDFLLICIREQLRKNPNLKVILMSASMDVDSLMGYFPGSEKIVSPGRLFPIDEYFLDDILQMISYESNAMKQVKLQRLREKEVMANTSRPVKPANEFIQEMSEAILDCFNSGSDDDFAQVMQLILTEGISANYQEDSTGYTALIVAAIHGKIEIAEQLINLGADIDLTTVEGTTALDCAKINDKQNLVHFLEDIIHTQGLKLQTSSDRNDLLSDYDATLPEDSIDFDLIKELVLYIHNSMDKRGGILIFLPGYDDLMNCYEFISTSTLPMEEIEIFMLHGSMQIGAQHKVFTRLYTKQKIVLATNVAETSITIDDICFVIDSGRAKEKSYDAFSGTHCLEKTWISKACVKQRAGRSGRTRPGVCFHTFSQIRFDSMMLSSTPEILRVPLEELCLHTKLFAPEGMEIANFLSLALEPPSTMAVEKAIQSLKSLGALDDQEQLTILGKHLLQISVEPHLGKMLIYGVILRCLDPVLTIVACLNQKDPFILPANAAQKGKASAKKKEMSEDTLSDHMSLLRAFQRWQEAKVYHQENYFCQENFVSASAMETIMRTRNQLLSQLRAEGFVPVAYRESIQEVNSFAESWPLVKAALLSGIYPQLAFLENRKLCTRTEKKVVCHISSCVHKQLDTPSAMCSWFMFDELSKIGSFASIKCTTLVTPATVGLIGGDITKYDKERAVFEIDEWIDFQPVNASYCSLRLALDKMVREKIRNPKHKSFGDKDIIHALNLTLVAEDIAAGLVQPVGIGARPQFLNNRQRNDLRRNQSQQVHNKRRYNEASGSNNGYYNRFNDRTLHNWRDRGSGRDGNKGSNYYNNDTNYMGRQRQQRFQDDSPGAYYSRGEGYKQGNRYENANNTEGDIKLGELFQPNDKYIMIRSFAYNQLAEIQAGTHCPLSTESEELIRSFMDGRRNVILLMSSQPTSLFQGAARVVNLPRDSYCTVEWLSKKQIFFSDVRERAQINFRLYYDAEEIEPEVGEKICRVLIQQNK